MRDRICCVLDGRSDERLLQLSLIRFLFIQVQIFFYYYYSTLRETRLIKQTLTVWYSVWMNPSNWPHESRSQEKQLKRFLSVCSFNLLIDWRSAGGKGHGQFSCCIFHRKHQIRCFLREVALWCETLRCCVKLWH